MKIKNKVEYLSSLTQYEIIKNSKKGDSFHHMKMELVKDISEYEEECFDKFEADLDLITDLAKGYLDRRGITDKDKSILAVEAYVQGYLDATTSLEEHKK